jgi:hypothetical protein
MARRLLTLHVVSSMPAAEVVVAVQAKAVLPAMLSPIFAAEALDGSLAMI